MRKIYFLILTCVFIIVGCSKIPNKVVSEKLDTDELSKAIKSDTLFANFYEIIRKGVDDMSDIKKATYNEITYRRLFKYVKYLRDTTYWNPLVEKWEKEWGRESGAYSTKADSVLDYWKTYLAENSLDKYVKIELTRIDKKYYDYIGGLEEVNLGFQLTPLQGTVEQIRFNYGYKAKINNNSKYYERHRCIETDPLSASRIGYWEVSYSDRDKFAGKNVETFLRDYDLYIEIASIRKDGINISIDDFNVPEEVSDYFNKGENDDSMRDYYKDKVIKKLINENYLRKWEYIDKKANELREKKDKLCLDFMEEIL